MDSTDPLYPVLENVVDSRRIVVEATSLEERQKEAARTAGSEYTTSLTALRQAVLEHPDFSTIHKAAWLEAIRRHAEDPTQVEQTATELVGLIEKLIPVFSEADIPIVEFERTVINDRPHVKSYKTAGTGFVLNGHLETAEVGVVHKDRPELRGLRIWMSSLNVVASSAEEVDRTQIEESLEKPKSGSDRLTSLIIGEEAIVRFAERLYGSGSEHSGDLIESLIKEAASVGINLEQRSETVQQDQERQRDERAQQMARAAFGNAILGYESSVLPERVRDLANESGVPLELVIEHIKRVRDKSIERTNSWLVELENAAQGQEELPK